MSRTLLVISASPDPDLPRRIAEDRSPRKDYLELARAVGGEILARDSVHERRVSRIVARLLGVPVAQAVLAFLRRREFDAVFTDAENVGLPLALMFKVTRTRRQHIMIGHLLSTGWKRYCFRFLKAQSHIDVIICHASRQRSLLERRLGVPSARIALLPYQVDARFWRPLVVDPERRICSVGLEFRDYRTLIEAVRGLDVEVTIAAASHWSKRRDETRDVAIPPNVQVTSLDYQRLRLLYARSRFVVVPLHDVDFQAGITTILEAMAMGKAVIVSRTRGQTDVVRGAGGLPPTPGTDRPSGYQGLEAGLGALPGPTGVYVPPADAVALRQAITGLLEQPASADRLGAAGRQVVERLMTLEQYVERIAALLERRNASAP